MASRLKPPKFFSHARRYGRVGRQMRTSATCPPEGRLGSCLNEDSIGIRITRRPGE
jgi:hypothetical protein